MKCMKCEEIISKKEFEQNQGLCKKCWNRFKLLEAINEEKEVICGIPTKAL